MATKAARQNVYQLAKYRQERAKRDEVDGIRVTLAERYNQAEIAELSTCRICNLPMDPAAVVNPNGEPFDTHPGCSMSTDSERTAA